MKKELYDSIVKKLNDTEVTLKFKFIVETKDYIITTFQKKDNLTVVEDIIKANTKPMKHDDMLSMMEKPEFKFHSAWTKDYFSIKYDKIKDKISTNSFSRGWSFAFHKKRFYPINQKTLGVCYSKNLYCFHYKTNKPRIMLASHLSNYDFLTLNLVKMLINIDFTPGLAVPLSKFINVKDEWVVLEKKLNIKIPKILKTYNIQDVYKLYSVLKNPNEISTLCKYISQINTRQSETEDFSIITINNIKNNSRHNLMALVSEMMISDDYYYLISDYINELFQLKDKTFSFKIKSVKRLQDEHRKTSKRVMMKGIKNIKVSDIYTEVFKTFPIKAELITTKKRLLIESIEQDHCVATYANKINNGESCIISIFWENKPYTLELSHSKKRGFTLPQCRGYRNCMPPESLMNLLKEHFKVINKDVPVDEYELVDMAF